MTPSTYYQQQHEKYNLELDHCRRRKTGLGIIRFGNIALLILVMYFTWQVSLLLAMALAFLLLLLFGWLVKRDIDNNHRIGHIQRLLDAVTQETLALKGKFDQFPGGLPWKPAQHRYAEDLDLFGQFSLFQFLNRAGSEPGEKKLAEWLLSPASGSEISRRNDAVKELASLPNALLEHRAFSMENRISIQTETRLGQWLGEPAYFSGFAHWKWIRYVFPVLMVSVLVLYISGILSLPYLIYSLLFSGVISYQLNKSVAPIHNSLSFMVGELNGLSKRLTLVEQPHFQSEELKNIQGKLVRNNQKGSEKISRLEQILSRLDLRYNMVLSAPLNLFLLWNIQQMLNLEKWKRDIADEPIKWIDSLATIDALNSFATLSFNQPDWVFPVINDQYFYCTGKEIGHPLIPVEKRINNSVSIASKGQIMLITGSNMAGKSTYLRSIGVNTVLAMAGAPVCARQFEISHVNLISSMRIADNLEESTSTFYAELKKLKQVIDAANEGEKILVLLDEILRGTNSHDRHIGSKALIRQLIQNQVVAIVATHDLALADYALQFPSHITNYYFDVSVNGEDLSFDYKLKTGICNSMNASVMMKKIGINLDDSEVSG